MTPYDRLMAESLPTGTFGRADPPRQGPRPWTALEQAEHHRVLGEVLSGWDYDRDSRRPHLHLVEDPTTGSHPGTPTHPTTDHHHGAA